MNIKTYDESDLRKCDHDGYKYEFIQDVPGDNPDIFGEYDNNEISDRLQEHSVYGKKDVCDPESCILYVYFKDHLSGKSFIKRLNDYITEKAKKVQDAQQF
jgi:hypothetical protein